MSDVTVADPVERIFTVYVVTTFPPAFPPEYFGGPTQLRYVGDVGSLFHPHASAYWVSLVAPGVVSYVAATDRIWKITFGKLRKVSSCSYPPGAVLLNSM